MKKKIWLFFILSFLFLFPFSCSEMLLIDIVFNYPIDEGVETHEIDIMTCINSIDKIVQSTTQSTFGGALTLQDVLDLEEQLLLP